MYRLPVFHCGWTSHCGYRSVISISHQYCMFPVELPSRSTRPQLTNNSCSVDELSVSVSYVRSMRPDCMSTTFLFLPLLYRFSRFISLPVNIIIICYICNVIMLSIRPVPSVPVFSRYRCLYESVRVCSPHTAYALHSPPFRSATYRLPFGMRC